MSFDQLLKSSLTSQDTTVDASWGQGRTLFGGISAALAFNQTRKLVDVERPLRSLSVNFSGQALAATPFSLSQELLSNGKSISQVTAKVIQNDRTVTHVTACFGLERDSGIQVTADKADLPKLGTNTRLNYIKGLTPEFVQHFEFEYSKGGFPFTNSPLNELAGWVRFKEPAEEFSEAHLIALIDAWPPTVLQKLKGFAPCATVSWNLEVIQPITLLEHPIAGDDWLYYEAEIKQAHHGYAHTEAKIYSADGTLLVLSRQLVAIYD